ncbi:MAG: NAD-dependent epimerase/dehydratase family protein [Pseudomonadota bacterium]
MTDPSPVFDTSAPVLVTGATGYLAGWLVKRLLDEGFTVHGAVRDPSNHAKVAHLQKLAEAGPGTLKLFKAELLEDGSYGEAMEGCKVVFHTASPFTTKFSDPKRDLVDPAVMGTRNVLASADTTASVERVVVTSSCAAIYGDNSDVAKAPGGVLTEEIWNTSSSLSHQPYSYSKAEAERAAWEIAQAQDRWSLVTINPSLILGPGVAGAQASESFDIVRQLGDGTMQAGVPAFEIGTVDVRDVAEAHLNAGFISSAAGRHIVSHQTKSLLELGQDLRKAFGRGWPFPTRLLPKWLVWIAGPLANKAFTRRMVEENMGHPWRADNSKSKNALGLTYRPVDAAVCEMFRQLVDAGAVKQA